MVCCPNLATAYITVCPSAACLSGLCLLPCSQSSGLHCISASIDIGNALFTASKAFLAAFATLAAIGKQGKAALAGNEGGQSKRKQSKSKALTSAAFDKVVASLPDRVRTTKYAHQALCIMLCRNRYSVQRDKRKKFGSAPVSDVNSYVRCSCRACMQLLSCSERSGAGFARLTMHVALCTVESSRIDRPVKQHNAHSIVRRCPILDPHLAAVSCQTTCMHPLGAAVHPISHCPDQQHPSSCQRSRCHSGNPQPHPVRYTGNRHPPS